MSLRKLFCTAAVAGFLLAFAPAALAIEQDPPDEFDALPFAPATQVWATRPLSAQPGQQPQQFLRLEISQLTPRFVTSDSPDKVTITGKIINIGDRKVSDIVLRLERGESLDSEDDVRKAVREPAAAEFIQPKFTEVADELQPGQQKDFTLEVPLRGTAPTSLAVDQPGIYPILANVNGKPDYGGQARLAALSTLLPVLGVPGGDTKGKPGAPAKLTMLWPIADKPKLVRVAADGRSELVDDEFATSLSVNGRLDSLLLAYERAVSSMSTSLCLAIDPDLLRTVEAMTNGYQIHGGTEGKGKAEAQLWLDRLKLAVAGRCVVAMPDADADLVALNRAKLVGLRNLALTGGAETVKRILGVQPLPDLVWPEDGLMDQATFEELANPQDNQQNDSFDYNGMKAALLDPSGVTDAPGTGPTRITSNGHQVTVVRTDSMVSNALQGSESRPRTLSGVTTPVENQPVSVQNALASLVFRAGWQGDGRQRAGHAAAPVERAAAGDDRVPQRRAEAPHQWLRRPERARGARQGDTGRDERQDHLPGGGRRAGAPGHRRRLRHQAERRAGRPGQGDAAGGPRARCTRRPRRPAAARPAAHDVQRVAFEHRGRTGRRRHQRRRAQLAVRHGERHAADQPDPARFRRQPDPGHHHEQARRARDRADRAGRHAGHPAA